MRLSRRELLLAQLYELIAQLGRRAVLEALGDFAFQVPDHVMKQRIYLRLDFRRVNEFLVEKPRKQQP